MGNEAARVRLLAAALIVAVGCTTKRINLAVDDGATDKVSVAGADADADAAADASTDFDQAYDAGMVVVGGGHYAQFTCCVLGDNNQCSDERLGGPDVCYDAPTWKQQASNRCAALGRNLGDSGVYGSCVLDAGP